MGDRKHRVTTLKMHAAIYRTTFSDRAVTTPSPEVYDAETMAFSPGPAMCAARCEVAVLAADSERVVVLDGLGVS